MTDEIDRLEALLREAEAPDGVEQSKEGGGNEIEAVRAVLGRHGYATDSPAATVRTLIEEHEALKMRHARELGWNANLENTIAAVRRAVGLGDAEPGDRS